MEARERQDWLTMYTPGLSLCIGLGALAWLLQWAELRWLDQAVLEALVIALLLGTLVRALWRPGESWTPGIHFAAKQVLEVAIVLLGASISLPLLLHSGPALLLAAMGVVGVGLAAGIAIGRGMGLGPKLAILVACGNAICGNSAIVAVAPVIEADAEDVAAAVAFTAVLGVAVVLGLPLLISLAGLSDYQYGVLAGLTVYAVPQVLAATFPVSTLSGEVGTLVKLIRVLLLGPTVLFFALRTRASRPAGATIQTYLPGFVIGFLALAAARSLGAIPDSAVGPVREASRAMTIVAMAALGLGVDVRAVAGVGRGVMLTATATLAALVALGLVLIRLLGI